MERLESIADLAAARPLWTELAERSGNIFATWEWADAWWRHFGTGDNELVLRACLRGDEPFAIAPLYRGHKGPVGLLRFLGHGVGDVLGPVGPRVDAGLAMRVLLAGMRGEGRWTALLAERIPADTAAALDGELLLSEENPSLRIGGRSWDDYMKAASKNMREKIRRNTRKIERDHELAFELCERPDQVEPMMRTLFDLHGMRWGAEGGSFGRNSVTPFHLDFAPTALECGWLRLWTMRIDDEPAAAWYGFRFGGTEAYYQSGRNPRFDRFSVGFLMLARTIQAAFDDGLDTYGFLRGDESYKGRFATETEALETRAAGNGAAGRGGVRAGALALRVPVLRDRIVSAIR